ncbi:hypothetical protein [Falsiroseomonas sp. E2-1-a4]|uniref:hypothetical protein n=1 Tax=Falsiroseomonas sp. E2-1-a4 TaxID=3239299 RepID=UPI003F2D8FE6
MALLTATAMLTACVSTREARIGAEDGDACRTQLVALDSTGNFFAEDILRGAAMGAVGGALLGGLLAAATGQRGSGIAAGAAIGAVGGGVAGGTAGYFSARQQQATDQASLSLAVASDLAAENVQLDRTQLAFNQLMDCRFRSAEQIRADLRTGRLARPQAAAAMENIRARTQRDIQLAQTINGQIANRGAQFDTAIDTLAPDVKQAAAMPVRALPAQPSGAVKLYLRPDAGSPEVAQLPARQRVTLRPSRNGFAQVETSSGVRGYAAAQAFPEAQKLGDRPALAEGRDVRSLAASNIARRDNFAESVGTAERLTAQGQGFELAT